MSQAISELIPFIFARSGPEVSARKQKHKNISNFSPPPEKTDHNAATSYALFLPRPL